MLTHETFLRAIFDNPDDDVARMAYADWLLEQGDPASAARGEFIHVQCQLARRSEGGGSLDDWADADRSPRLLERAQELLLAHGEEWAKPLASRVRTYQFRRGFIDEVSVDANHFLGHAETILALAPIQRVRFITPWSPAVADCPHLARLSGIDLQRLSMGDAGLRIVLSSPHLTRLRYLDLSSDYITDRGARLLADSPWLARLTHLNLGYNHLTLDGVKSLYQSRYWPHLAHLSLTGNSRIDARAMQFLGQTLQGSGEPALLRSLLQMSSREEREYTCTQVREMAQRAAQPGQATRVLAQGLGAGNRKQRAAAAQMLSRLGAEAAPALPALVQRLFESNALVRDHAAPALARLLPTLSPALQNWLCVLANPLLPPLVNLRSALARADLPTPVREEFARLCARRLAWRQHIAAGQQGPAPVPDAVVALDRESILQAVDELMKRAEQMASKHYPLEADREEVAAIGRTREAAWLVARLCEQLQAVLPAAPPAAPAGRKVRK
jgi:uncharacterized protein (TIGR02996 family)